MFNHNDAKGVIVQWTLTRKEGYSYANRFLDKLAKNAFLRTTGIYICTVNAFGPSPKQRAYIFQCTLPQKCFSALGCGSSETLKV